MNEIPPTAVNWLPPVGPGSPGTFVVDGLIALVGWNVAAATLLSVAVHELVVPAVVGVLALAASNVVIASVLAVVGWRGGIAPDEGPSKQ